jgi:hypothetical protein
MLVQLFKVSLILSVPRIIYNDIPVAIDALVVLQDGKTRE